MRYLSFPGIGERIKSRLLAVGYVNEDGEPDVAGFIRDKHYDPRSFYPWINKGRTPAGENLTRLADDLKIGVEWLLMGHECEAPAAGKGERRQGRRTVGSLLLALSLGAASAIGWPSGGVSAQPPSLPESVRVSGVSLIRRWLRHRDRLLAPPLLPSWGLV